MTPSLHLPALMLSLNAVGIMAGLLREPRPYPLTFLALLTSIAVLSVPLFPLTLLAYFRLKHLPLEATFGGVASALTGAVCCYVLLDPELNRDANIGLGLYGLFGVVFPLGVAYVAGLMLGHLWGMVRKQSS